MLSLEGFLFFGGLSCNDITLVMQDRFVAFCTEFGDACPEVTMLMCNGCLSVMLQQAAHLWEANSPCLLHNVFESRTKFCICHF